MDQNVLVIEDNRDINALVSLHLRGLRLRPVQAFDGANGLQLALQGEWALIVLDLSLPGMDGVELCRRVRHHKVFSPLLMLTARSEEHERALGLDSGADDYLAKPFGVLELIARARALLRRAQLFNAATTATHLHAGDIELDLERRTAKRACAELALTTREFDLLHHFVAHPGRVFTRAQLLDQVWGCTDDVYEHAVSSHINRLRSKIEPNPQAPQHLVTVWGVGYRFDTSTLTDASTLTQ